MVIDTLQKLRANLESTQEPDPLLADCFREIEALRQQLASRDAEVAKWKDAYLKVVERIHMVGGYQDQSKERDQLREQVTLLRDALDGASQIITFEGVPYYLLDTYERDEALAATEPKP